MTKAELQAEPVDQFSIWYNEFLELNWIRESTAFYLATSHKNQPAVRTVLLKGFDKKGFVFYTNYKGRKGRELKSNSKVALLFYWPPLNRQVRIEGVAKKVSRKESEAYFATRALESQLGAWASMQSEEIPGREFLLEKLNFYKNKFSGGEVPCPPHWGGFRVQAKSFEFWESREFRLHDRFIYTKKGSKWKIHQLSP